MTAINFSKKSTQSRRDLMKRSNSSKHDLMRDDGENDTVVVEKSVRFPLDVSSDVRTRDNSLQSMNKRRRFMRRGSRSASMMLSAATVSLEEVLDRAVNCCKQSRAMKDQVARIEAEPYNMGGCRPRGLITMKDINESLLSIQTVDSVSEHDGLGLFDGIENRIL